MITETKKNVIERKGVQSEGLFQIKATGKAFRILSDGLYSDKIQAIMRELSCNAYDAHVSAKNLDTPFIIHIPNKLEPFFKIRDFGVGLSHNDVINVYTTYFESTKTDSNDYIGCLGLGSKSPFSYVDNFSIVSYLDGERRVYNAFINEDETPTIALMDTQETTEPNGVEISFPVQANDNYKFESKACNIFTYFKLKPKFEGAKIEVSKVDYLLEGSNWGVRDSKYGSATAVMGNVSYKLSDFSGDIDSDIQALMASPIDIFFDIGDLEVAASRENLSYNKRTIANIEAVFKGVIKDIRAKANEKVNNCDTLWEARCSAYDILAGEYKYLKKILEDQNVFEWNGIPINNTYTKVDNEGINILNFAIYTSRRRYNNKTSVKRSETKTIHTNSGTRIFWADMNKGSHLRCKQVIIDSLNNIDGNDVYGINNVYLVSGGKENIEELRIELGLKEIPAISTIERRKESKIYKTATYNPKNATRLLVYEEDVEKHDYNVPSTYWRKEKVDIDDGGVYVPINRYKIHGCDPANYIDRMRTYYSSIGGDLNDIVIVGAKDSVVEKLVCNGKWKTLNAYVKEKVEEYVKTNKIAQKINDAKAIHEYDSHNNSSRSLIFIISKMDLDKTKPCGQFFERVQALRDSVKDKDALMRVGVAMSCLGIVNDAKVINCDGWWNEVEKSYPLFNICDGWSIGDYKNGIKEYIDALDTIKF